MAKQPIMNSEILIIAVVFCCFCTETPAAPPPFEIEGPDELEHPVLGLIKPQPIHKNINTTRGQISKEVGKMLFTSNSYGSEACRDILFGNDTDHNGSRFYNCFLNKTERNYWPWWKDEIRATPSSSNKIEGQDEFDNNRWGLHSVCVGVKTVPFFDEGVVEVKMSYTLLDDESEACRNLSIKEAKDKCPANYTEKLQDPAADEVIGRRSISQGTRGPGMASMCVRLKSVPVLDEGVVKIKITYTLVDPESDACRDFFFGDGVETKDSSFYKCFANNTEKVHLPRWQGEAALPSL